MPHRTAVGLFIAIALTLVSSGRASLQDVRSIETDRDTYVAGDEVVIQGHGFAPFEAVTLSVTHEDGTAEAGMGHEALEVTAAADGSFLASWTPQLGDLAGPRFVARASSNSSMPAASNPFLRVASLAPDRGDYQPGDTALLSGHGFAPGEVVEITVTHVNGAVDGNGHQPFFVTANDAGAFTASWYVDPDDSLGSQFRAAAIGAGSGVVGTTTFWDAGAVSLTMLGLEYKQDFDTLASTSTSSTVPTGWALSESGTNANATYTAGTGSGNAGDTYSFGASGSSERAFGQLRSGTLISVLGAQFTNDTGAQLLSLAVTYTGEMWRLGTSGRAADRMQFEFSTDATSLTTGTWTAIPALSFSSPVTVGTVGALNGNADANRKTLASTIAPSGGIANGATFWIRWTDADASGADDGLAIDDFSLTPRDTIDQAPSVSSTTPAPGATGVPLAQTLSVTFSEPVNAPAAAFGLTCAASGVHALTVGGGPTTYTLDPATDFVNSELCTLTVTGSQVTDVDTDDPPDTMTADFVATFTTMAPETAPTVSSTIPANNAANVPVDQTLSVTFSEPVTVVNPWFTLTCPVSGAHAAVISGGPTVFTINPSSDFAFGESCTLMIDASKVADVDGNDPPDNMAFNFTATFGTELDQCLLPFTHAYAIQGAGASAAITGAVTTQGVVVGDYEGDLSLGGFFLQDASGDGNAATSDGIFIFNGSANSVSLGDVVRVTGTAKEFQGQTEVDATSIRKCGTGSVAPTDISFPVASSDFLERYEGMLVRVVQPMTVTEHFQLGRFGQVVLSSDGRLPQPTNVTTPGAAAIALQAENALRSIILDDALQTQNPDPIAFARGGLPLSASNTLRGGDTATGIVGVLNYTWAGNAASGNAYRIRPLNALNGFVNFVAANPRPAAAPAVDGTVKAVGMNLLNFFNTFTNCLNGVGGAPSDCRGAGSQSEFDRQYPKTVAAILALNPDVLGVNELENDGYGPASALQFLVDRLNASAGPGTYGFIDVDAATGQVNALGTDAIRIALIYKPAVVSPVGQTAALNSEAFVNGGDGFPRNRASLAQAFSVKATGAVFIVDVNHLKSKGSACDAADTGDGQGNCNQVRVNAATELMSWLASDPTGTGDPDILLLGDYNSYAQEDPIAVIKNAGFTNLIETRLGPDAYSYVFDAQWGYLDHALASASLVSQVSGVGDYHINSDEPSVLDYNTDFKTANLQTVLYAPDQFRVSDHDPVIVGLTPNAPPSVSPGGSYSVNEGGTITLTARGSDPNGDTLTYAWDLDGNGSFETPGSSVDFSAAQLQAPGSVTVAVRATDSGGLSATATATITIVYAFSGFFGPVDNLPVVNQVNAGRAIPLKFSLAGYQGLNVLAAGSPQSRVIPCDPSGGLDTPEATRPAGASGLQYDALAGTYVYIWKSDKSWAGSCRQLVVTLTDGTVHRANFSFVK